MFVIQLHKRKIRHCNVVDINDFEEAFSISLNREVFEVFKPLLETRKLRKGENWYLSIAKESQNIFLVHPTITYVTQIFRLIPYPNIQGIFHKLLQAELLRLIKEVKFDHLHGYDGMVK